MKRDQILVAEDFNPRKEFDDRELAGLATSIKSRGILQPLRVRPHETPGMYVLVSGERRLRANDSLGADGFDEIPVIIADTAADHGLDAIIENVQRQALSPVEEAWAYLALQGKGYTPKGIADIMGVATARVTSRLEILELPQKAIDAIGAEKIPPSAIKPLVKIAKVSPKLAIAAVKACAGKPERSGILAKEPHRIVAHLANESPAEFAHSERRFGPKNVRDFKVADSEKVAKALEAIPCEQWEQPFVSLSDEQISSLAALGGAYSLPDDEYVFTDLEAVVTQVAIAAEQETTRRKEYKAKLREQSGKGPKISDLPKAEQEVAREAAAKQRAADAEARAKARTYNLELGRMLQLDGASAPLNATSADIVVGALLASLDLGRIGKRGMRYVLESASKVEGEKVTYPTTLGECRELVLKFMDGAKTPEEKLGRMCVVMAAAALADEGAVAPSNQVGRYCPGNAITAGAYGVALLNGDAKSHARKFVGELEKEAKAAPGRGSNARQETEPDIPEVGSEPEITQDDVDADE